jgi:hypothetical protein
MRRAIGEQARFARRAKLGAIENSWLPTQTLTKKGGTGVPVPPYFA